MSGREKELENGGRGVYVGREVGRFAHENRVAEFHSAMQGSVLQEFSPVEAKFARHG